MDKDLKNNLTQLYGPDILRYDETFVMNTLRKRMTGTNEVTTEDYVALILKDGNERDVFFNSLQNKYTEFFRNSLTFAVLEKIIFPSIVTKKNHRGKTVIRIWSAACSTGQEAYSLAMIIEDFKLMPGEKFQYIILASDRDESSVKQAQQGIYTPDSLNNVTFGNLNKWFSVSGKNYSVNSELKKNISFFAYDLLDERWTSPPTGIYGAFDLIVGCNLLFYYNEEFRKTIIDKLSNCLDEGGYLVTGEAEREMLLHNNYIEVMPQSGIFLKNPSHEH
jgi:chemotaxis methyl-accepting protein methylase